MFRGIYSAVFTVTDLPKAVEWYGAILKSAPYTHETAYAGFNIGGLELGLQAGTAEANQGPLIYFLVDNIEEMTDRVTDLGGTLNEPILHIGGPVYTAICCDPFGNTFGLIENPRL